MNIVYGSKSKIVEKIQRTATWRRGGGEYSLQDGFGWTNGVTATLIDMYYDSDAM